MGWKDLPYWIKGGVIFFVFRIVIGAIIILSSPRGDFGRALMLGFLDLPITLIIANSPLNINIGSYLMNNVLLTILGLIFWFVIGAIIGWIVGKIKNK